MSAIDAGTGGSGGLLRTGASWLWASVGPPWARLLFTALYASTVLPFTVGLFTDVIGEPTLAPGSAWMASVHRASLPLFLAFLEYASVRIACLFWQSRAASLLAIFALCQGFAVASTYLDVRTHEWRRLLSAEASRVLDGRRASSEDRELRRELEGRLERSVRRIETARRDLLRLAQGPTISVRGGDPDAESLLAFRLRERRMATDALRQGLDDERSRAAQLGRRLLAVEGASQPKNGSPVKVPPTAIGFVADSFDTPESLLTLGLAMVFPLTVLAVARVLVPTSTRATNSDLMCLEREIARIEALPPEAQARVASMALPALTSSVASLRAVRGSLAEGTALEARLEADLDVLASCGAARDRIVRSHLSGEAKRILIIGVDRATLASERSRPESP